MGSHSFIVDGNVFHPGNPLVIAEIGTGHGGDRVKAGELLRAAREAGAGCVKFQHVYAREIIHPRTGNVPLPGGSIPLFERFRSLETGPDFFADLKEQSEALGLLFLCTPFGVQSARELAALGIRAVKVASPELNHLDLLDEVARTGLPVILSSGVSTLGDIERAVERLRRKAEGNPAPALLHCVSAYPAPEEDYNLRVLEPLSILLGLAVGVSDHSLDPVLVPSLAVCSGAAIVEKHICLSRSDTGLDDPIALPPGDFLRMTNAVRFAAEDPRSARETLEREYGSDKLEAVLGDGRKRLAFSERGNYGRTNRSLHALRPIRRGESFTRENVAALRTEKILRPGLGPEFLDLVLGRRAAREVPDGEGIEWGDVGAK